MARVLLTHSYFYRLDPKQWKDARPYPPLGTLLAAAVIREGDQKIRGSDDQMMCRRVFRQVLRTKECVSIVSFSDRLIF